MCKCLNFLIIVMMSMKLSASEKRICESAFTQYSHLSENSMYLRQLKKIDEAGVEIIDLNSERYITEKINAKHFESREEVIEDRKDTSGELIVRLNKLEYVIAIDMSRSETTQKLVIVHENSHRKFNDFINSLKGNKKYKDSILINENKSSWEVAQMLIDEFVAHYMESFYFPKNGIKENNISILYKLFNYYAKRNMKNMDELLNLFYIATVRYKKGINAITAYELIRTSLELKPEEVEEVILNPRAAQYIRRIKFLIRREAVEPSFK